ncbi:hypothetical protein TIFTF001_040584 [Ficus carica]|uniref:Uncharacterized protein n=1 Tax=Ficus carica TaxID=3494 RepID=A0AA88CKB7_FICCA|nr:hypothetical protein TIFTF001_040582 [Ficus carica]GMN24601.1 hypothetical protein TIFTF001_040584 [Ficus carica]
MENQQEAVGASLDPSRNLHVHSPVDKYVELVGGQNYATPNYIPDEFSMQEFSDWEERMDWHCVVPDEMLPYIELYREQDPTLDLQTERLMPFERAYILQLVAIIVGAITRTPSRRVTPTLRNLVNLSWESMCRLGVRPPALEKLVAASQKPTPWFEASKGVEEAVRAWRVCSDDVRSMRQMLALRMEASKNSDDHDDQRSALEDVERLRKIVAAKEEEVQNWLRIFKEKKDLEPELINSFWCSFP